MLPQYNTKYIVITLTVIILLVILSSFYIQKNLTETYSQKTSGSRTFPTEAIRMPSYKILHKENNDRDGRTLVYSTGLTGANYYSGRGIVMDPKSGRIRYIVGFFGGWEDIAQSVDKYILIKDPESSTILMKARVVFNKEAVTSESDPATGLAVENLDLLDKK